MMLFSPAGSTAMIACPVGTSATVTGATSTPAAAIVSVSQSSPGPMQPTCATSAPDRAAAIDWFAPLPPSDRRIPVEASVSPGPGRCGTRYR
jgi:hypothetical protein